MLLLTPCTHSLPPPSSPPPTHTQIHQRYVWLGANSSFKAESDLAKYEKARKLKDYIDSIRTNYTRDWGSSDLRKKQARRADRQAAAIS